MIVGSRMPVILDEWKDEDILYRLVEKAGAFELERWWSVPQKWSTVDDSLMEVFARRLVLRINLNDIEARRISFLMRCIQLAKELVGSLYEADSRDASADQVPPLLAAEGHLAALKGVALACGMPLERWEVQIEGVEEDPETAEARRRLGLDVKASS